MALSHLMAWRSLAAASTTALAALPIAAASHLNAQALTENPAAWRPLSYADLQHPTQGTATFVDIWKDAIDDNNRAYLAKGDRRYVFGNAPAIEAHFVIWSAQKSVVLSVLDTATGCTGRRTDQAVGATVRMCPVRIARYQGAIVHTVGGGRICFLELDRVSPAAGSDPTRSAAYASYDVKTKTINTGLIVNHKAVDGCSIAIPLPL